MWRSLLLFIAILHSTIATWATLYSFEDGRVYMRLKNDNLVALNISLYGSSLQSQNLNQNTQLETLPSPPANSSLFVYSSNLYAFAANSLSSSSNFCSDGSLLLYVLNKTSSSWSLTSPILYSGILDTSYYQDAVIFTAPGSSDVYIYGGRCSSGTVSGRLASLDMNSHTLFNVTTSTQPQPFYGAASLWAPNAQSLVVIGGKSSVGWLNMYQMATWSFQSGWSFQEATQSGTATVDSRISPLVLPIFTPSTASGAQSFLSSYAPTGALVIGGSGDRSLQSPWAQITFGNQKWSLSNLQPPIDELNLLGGFVIFDTFVAVNSSTKRDSMYALNLYDLGDNFKPISNLRSSQVLQNSLNKKSDSSKTIKILIGVLVPLALLAIVAAVVIYLYRRKTGINEHESIIEATDYQFGHFRNALDQPYSILGRRPLDLFINNNDTASTLEINSIDLWVRKRQEYEANRISGGLRHSYLASQETLTSPSDYNSYDDSISEKTHSDNNFNESSNIQSPASSPVHFLEAIGKRPLGEYNPQTSRLNKLKSQSFTMTPPGLPMLKKKSILDPGHVQLEASADCASVESNMDVQVLVSSKRKLILRVMNPDEEGAETFRQRQPS